jgi:hypothetical protein
MSDSADNSPKDSVLQQADDRLVHALLVHLHEPQAGEHREQRVQQVMTALRKPSPTQASTPSSGTSQRWRFPAWARRTIGIAAMLLIAASLWVLLYQPTPALASINDILSALGRPGDRTYHIAMVDLPEPPGRGPRDEPSSVPRPGLNDATLYLRDGKAYLLVRHSPNNGGQILDGYDGRQSWRVRDGVLDEVHEGLGAGGIPMPSLMADVPFSDLHQTLERVRVDYTVEQLDQAAMPSGGERLRHVLVRRNSHAVKGPETIEIWANPATAIPQRIVFDRAKVQGNHAPCRITLDLIGQTTLPTDWFSPGPHLAVDGKLPPMK